MVARFCLGPMVQPVNRFRNASHEFNSLHYSQQSTLMECLMDINYPLFKRPRGGINARRYAASSRPFSWWIGIAVICALLLLLVLGTNERQLTRQFDIPGSTLCGRF
jgi:hypothetical protein